MTIDLEWRFGSFMTESISAILFAREERMLITLGNDPRKPFHVLLLPNFPFSSLEYAILGFV